MCRTDPERVILSSQKTVMKMMPAFMGGLLVVLLLVFSVLESQKSFTFMLNIKARFRLAPEACQGKF